MCKGYVCIWVGIDIWMGIDIWAIAYFLYEKWTAARAEMYKEL